MTDAYLRKTRTAAGIGLLVLALAACRILAPVSTPSPEPPTATELLPTHTPAPTETPTETPAPTATLALPTLAPTLVVESEAFEVRAHPDGGLFAGDLVSFEIIGPQELDLEGQEASLSIDGGPVLGTAGFGGFGIGGRRQATLQWIWDTAGLEPGDYELEIEILPAGTSFTRPVTLLPEALRAFPEPGASWAMSESDCCLFYYVTGTAAERDLQLLMDTADLEADLAVDQLGVDLAEAIPVVFLPRVLGHGGFAGGEIYISYLDRNYAGNAPRQVLHHEIVHILDGRAGGEFRPSLFVEGLAVLLSGGHFKPEPIVPRAAALLDLNAYLPLTGLADDFYFSQHEISYLQGAALIQFIVDSRGWEAFETFYRDIRPHESNQQSAAIDAALEVHFGLSLAELEADFMAYLVEQPHEAEHAVDVDLSVRFFDTVRRYQQALDPSAYFLTAWLLGIDEMLDRAIVADYLRHPSAPENVALETLLVAADLALRAGDYENTDLYLEAVNAVLDAIEAGDPAAFEADPLAADHFALTLAAMDAGYEPHQITIDGESAVVTATDQSTDLIQLTLIRNDTAWNLAE